MHPVITNWQETRVVWPDLEAGFDPSVLTGKLTVSAVDSAILKSALDIDLVKSWVAGEANEGIMLVPHNAGFIAEFFTTENGTKWPTLAVTARNGNNQVDTTVVGSYGYLAEASLLFNGSGIAEMELKRGGDRLTVGNGSGFRSLLRFDLSGIPINATINQAFLTLTVHSEGSRTRDFGLTLAASPVVSDSSWNPVTLLTDSLYSHPKAIALDSLVTFSLTNSTLYPSAIPELTGIVQRWTLNLYPNWGLVLRSAEPGLNPDQMSFYSGETDSTLAPELRVTYTTPPSPRFDVP